MALTIIHLGGSVHRLNKAIEVYRQHPGAFIIISSESNTQQCVDKLKAAGIPSSDYVFDFNAWNTITNFTATYNYIRKRGTKTLFVCDRQISHAAIHGHCQSCVFIHGR
jgi:uncharacterized SAM-binding protein YcdF (DUF218 family)